MMPIYRMVTPWLQEKPWFVEAPDMAAAEHMARKGKQKDVEVREWEHCMAPQHNAIPEAGTGRQARNCAKAHVLHDCIPHCPLCLRHATMTLEAKVERLERILTELQDDFERHGELED
jgi:hypothetical protein